MSSPVLDELNEPQAEAVEHVNGPLLVFAGAGQRQDARHHLPDREPRRVRARPAVPHPRRHLHEQGRRRDAHAPRAAPRRRTSRGTSGWAPSTRRARSSSAATARPSALARELRHLRHGDQKAGRHARPPRRSISTRSATRRAPCLARIHKQKQEAPRPGRDGASTTYVDEAVVQASTARYEEQLRAANAVDFEDLILSRAAHPRGEPAGRGRRDPAPLRLRPRRRVPGHERHPVPLPPGARARRTGTSASSATTTRPSTAGAAPTSATSAASARTSPTPTVVKLEQNYRSTGRIVKAALGVIEPSQRARARRSCGPTNADGRAGRRRRHATTSATRRRTCVERIQEARARGVDPKEIAVFYRIHAQSRVLEEALRAAQRPLPDHRRARSSTSAPRSRTRSRTCASSTNPRSDVDLLAHHQRARARHRRDDRRAPGRARRRSEDVALGCARARRAPRGEGDARDEASASAPPPPSSRASTRCSPSLRAQASDAAPERPARRRCSSGPAT